MTEESNMTETSIQELPQQVAVLEERMNTKQAEYKTDIGKLSGEYKTAIERLRTDMAIRDKQLLLAIFGMLALAVAFLGFMIGLD